MTQPVIPRLHLVTDDEVLASPNFEGAALSALEAGAGKVAFHLRGPRSSGRRLWEIGEALLPEARRRAVPLLVNDRVDAALALGASGVHLGLRSLPAKEARAILGAEALVGRSVHGAGEAEALFRALGSSTARTVDFLLVGTLFPTPSHPGSSGTGPRAIGAVRGACPGLPAVGIGGITADRVPEVLDAGAHGVAVLGAVWNSRDPGAAVGDLVYALERQVDAVSNGGNAG